MIAPLLVGLVPDSSRFSNPLTPSCHGRPVLRPFPVYRFQNLKPCDADRAGDEANQNVQHVKKREVEEVLQKPIELKSYCVPSYTSKQELHILERRVLPWNPDLLILHHDPNDALFDNLLEAAAQEGRHFAMMDHDAVLQQAIFGRGRSEIVLAGFETIVPKANAASVRGQTEEGGQALSSPILFK